jgi:hypothetical protein
VTTSLDKLGYRIDQNGDEITRELIEETILSNIELILKRIPNEPLDWNVGEFI